ncbi:hypothetical protein QA612_17170 [Evansella sp. AB-P1]|uniref:hypothetical protein n=1 Tax=Evansella sp. AB-P1 TaxID=3037653 RepID=UPI00241D29AE|nr:hypothetical protein [Evansella sp. AB-P1]MDG5789192.1 hypothetical protein [Evansella sp. AB-P1]
MNKWLTSTALVSAVAVGSYLMNKQDNREKVGHYWNRMKAIVKRETKEEHEPYYVEKVGHSDPYDVEDNSMVDEGAVYSINYYNRKKQNNA